MYRPIYIGSITFIIGADEIVLQFITGNFFELIQQFAGAVSQFLNPLGKFSFKKHPPAPHHPGYANFLGFEGKTFSLVKSILV